MLAAPAHPNNADGEGWAEKNKYKRIPAICLPEPGPAGDSLLGYRLCMRKLVRSDLFYFTAFLRSVPPSVEAGVGGRWSMRAPEESRRT